MGAIVDAPTAGRDQLFIVRLWPEPGKRGSDWRGSVEHVGSGQRMYFGRLGDMADFISLRLASVQRPIESKGGC